MARHSFIQISKLPDVIGRIDYISNGDRQENLYATYRTADLDFWRNLAKESQEEFRRFGSDGKCIEARELIIALPESYTRFDPDTVLRDFTEQFKKRYGMECISALHHNKAKSNYHIHLIFSERQLLPEPDIKIASRAVFYDESGKRVRTKKEITGEDGNIRAGCTVIKKGEVYEQHLFTAKEETFKSNFFLEDAKRFYTALINRHIEDPAQRLKVFDPNGIYLPTKKIGKNNPRAEEIRADNEARQDWNRTADMALVVGVPEEEILEAKQEQIHEKTVESIRVHGWLPGLFRGIVQKAKAFLDGLIRQREVPPQPTLSIDMAEFRAMQNLMAQLRRRARVAKEIQEIEIPKLKAQLAETKGLFKGKERKAIEAQITEAEHQARALKDEIFDLMRQEGYPDGQAFLTAYNKADSIVRQYNRDLAEWERRADSQAEKPRRKSVLEELRRVEAETKHQPRRTRTAQHQMDAR